MGGREMEARGMYWRVTWMCNVARSADGMSDACASKIGAIQLRCTEVRQYLQRFLGSGTGTGDLRRDLTIQMMVKYRG